MKTAITKLFGICVTSATIVLSQITTVSANFTCGGFECNYIRQETIDGKEYKVYINIKGEKFYVPIKNNFLRCNRENPQKIFQCSSVTRPEPGVFK